MIQYCSINPLISSTHSSLKIELLLMLMPHVIIFSCQSFSSVVIHSVSPSITLEAKAQVEGGATFLCAREVKVNGIIDADGIVVSFIPVYYRVVLVVKV